MVCATCPLLQFGAVSSDAARYANLRMPCKTRHADVKSCCLLPCAHAQGKKRNACIHCGVRKKDSTGNSCEKNHQGSGHKWRLFDDEEALNKYFQEMETDDEFVLGDNTDEECEEVDAEVSLKAKYFKYKEDRKNWLISKQDPGVPMTDETKPPDPLESDYKEKSDSWKACNRCGGWYFGPPRFDQRRCLQSNGKTPCVGFNPAYLKKFKTIDLAKGEENKKMFEETAQRSKVSKSKAISEAYEKLKNELKEAQINLLKAQNENLTMKLKKEKKEKKKLKKKRARNDSDSDSDSD